jgi:alginate production protein
MATALFGEEALAASRRHVARSRRADLAWSLALAVCTSAVLPAFAAQQVTTEPAVELREAARAEGVDKSGVAVNTVPPPPSRYQTSRDPRSPLLAQFQLPPQDPVQGELPSSRPRELPGRLPFQYSIGSESDVTYRRDPDLDKRVRDNLLLLGPQVNALMTYRPNDQVEMTVEVILEKEIALHEEPVIQLPSGDTKYKEPRRTTFVFDQAFVTYKAAAGALDLTFGRRNFEDDRHWWYDTSLDVGLVRFKSGPFQAEASIGRKDAVNLDLAKQVERGHINNYLLNMTYRGIEDVRLAGYVFQRDDRAKKEGRPLWVGASADGRPSDRFNYWAQFALLRGTDELDHGFSAHGYEVGATYRFIDVRMSPSLTFGYAFATGDDNPDDTVNQEFRQTGLQSNEVKFSGFSKFKGYGETFDPELSNLRIFTAALGVRLAPSVHLDVVYHRYGLNKLAEEARNSGLTAQMGQVASQASKDVGSEVDLVLGFRNLFGVRRLGLDLRAGLFRPGKAFLRNDGTARNPNIQPADKGIAVIAKFWY